MAELVAQAQQGAFSDPQNGSSPIDANEVTANDNALRTKHNVHDADGTIHVQSSTLAARLPAGIQGRKWWTVDGGAVRCFYDTGSAWVEVAYVSTSDNATINGVLTFATSPEFTADVVFDENVSILKDLDVTGDLQAAQITATAGLDVTGDVDITGDVIAATFTGDGSGLTALPAGELSGTIDNGRLPANVSVTTLAASGTTTAAGYRAASGVSYGHRTTSSGSGGTIDASTTNHHRITMTGTGTITISNMSDAQRLLVEVLQDGGGGRVVTWSGVTAWPGGTTPTATATPSRKDVFIFVKCGSDVLGFVGAYNFASTS